MSSWLQPSRNAVKPEPVLRLPKNKSGFFACCSVRLEKIVGYYNTFRSLPDSVDSSGLFELYKEEGHEIVYFEHSSRKISYRPNVEFATWFQFIDYTRINYAALKPFLQIYYTPSTEITAKLKALEEIYSLEYANTCVLFYRGNDKITETPIAPYQDYIDRGKRLEAENPGIRFMIQSDETEFIDSMLSAFPKAFYCKKHVRHIKKSVDTVDRVFRQENHIYSKWYLAITMAMAKAKYVICGSGNCSLWICLYRGNADGVQQYLKGEWL